MSGFSFLRPPRTALLRCAPAVPAGAVCGCGVVHAAPARIGRRAVLGALAAGTVLGSLPSPLRAAVPGGPLERPDVTIGFVPISCAAPLIMAEAQGFFVQEGLRVQLQKMANWALVRDRLLDGHLDASHLLSPMPLALSLGLGGNAPHAVHVASMQNLNGQAITLALRHHDRRDPRQWKGMTFAIPFEFSMHNLLLRAYLARYGLDPDHDVTLRVTAPPDMVANLRAGNIDGFLGPEPFNQRAVIEEIGFLHILTAEIWDGHPCCAFGMTAAFMDANPNTAAALQRAMIRAADFMQQADNRAQAARVMAQPRYLNQPELVIRQSLTGHYADGLGVVRDNPRRAAYSPYPYPSMAVWILSQFERWGYLKGPVDYRDVAQQVFLIDSVRQQAQAMNLPQPADGGNNWPSFNIMGQHFDPDHPSFFNQG